MNTMRVGSPWRKKTFSLLFAIVLSCWVGFNIYIAVRQPYPPVDSTEPQKAAILTVSSSRHDEEGRAGATAHMESSRPNIHIIFSTGCSAFQDWQSYVFFFHAKQSGQRGRVTRVASGCDSAEAERELLKTHETQIHPLSENFHLHITPDYSRTTIPGKNYKFFNKPFGLLHFLENGLGFPKHPPSEDDTIFVILDPDEMIVRPFEADFGEKGPLVEWKHPPQAPIQVRHGHPYAQYYLLLGPWVNTIRDNRHKILATLSNRTEANRSGLHSQWDWETVRRHYAAGPPIMATGRDMYKIVLRWCTFAVPVYQLTENHLSEMFAYAVAAGHWNLSHNLGASFMVSNVQANEEGWSWADMATDDKQVGPSNICDLARSQYDAIARSSDTHYLPNVIHYCQRYFLGPFFFSKYILPKNFLECGHPLLKEPPVDLARAYKMSVTPNGVLNKITTQTKRNRMAFMLCPIVSGVNRAAYYWKQQHCNQSEANFKYEFLFQPKDKKEISDEKREVKIWK